MEQLSTIMASRDATALRSYLTKAQAAIATKNPSVILRRATEFNTLKSRGFDEMVTELDNMDYLARVEFELSIEQLMEEDVCDVWQTFIELFEHQIEQIEDLVYDYEMAIAGYRAQIEEQRCQIEELHHRRELRDVAVEVIPVDEYE
jgi:soluble cytochrome b562